MAKIVLNDAATLADVVSNINSNNATLETAMENTLSRDGTSPNAMAASLDMNSNRILNLPLPLNPNEPARKQDLADALGVAFPNISAFMLTMLDDANAAGVFGTLGVSAFIQTLLDDTTAAAARSTLGVSTIATLITVANEASDTTCFPAFFTSATGDMDPKTNASLTFNSSTGALGSKSLVLAQGTITDPALQIDGTVTWNDAADTFTGWKLNVTNTNSNSASKPLDIQVGGSSQFSVQVDGKVSGARFVSPGSSVSAHKDAGFTFGEGNDGKMLLLGAVYDFRDGINAGTTWRTQPCTPATITANQNDYNPGGFSYYQRWSSDAARDVTGLTFSVTKQDGMEHRIINVGSQNITLKHNVTSTAANRFQNTTGADIVLTPGQQAWLIYEGTSGGNFPAWRVTKLN